MTRAIEDWERELFAPLGLSDESLATQLAAIDAGATPLIAAGMSHQKAINTSFRVQMGLVQGGFVMLLNSQVVEMTDTIAELLALIEREAVIP